MVAAASAKEYRVQKVSACCDQQTGVRFQFGPGRLKRTQCECTQAKIKVSWNARLEIESDSKFLETDYLTRRICLLHMCGYNNTWNLTNG
jgi:hypothetical protein